MVAINAVPLCNLIPLMLHRSYRYLWQPSAVRTIFGAAAQKPRRQNCAKGRTTQGIFLIDFQGDSDEPTASRISRSLQSRAQKRGGLDESLLGECRTAPAAAADRDPRGPRAARQVGQ